MLNRGRGTNNDPGHRGDNSHGRIRSDRDRNIRRGNGDGAPLLRFRSQLCPPVAAHPLNT